jgi:1-acyl-sn-glycerol-3-phosphate acyltransferase
MAEREPMYHAAEWILRPFVFPWFTYRFEGMEHIPKEGPALVAGNHVSYYDPLLDANMIDRAGRRPRFLAKAELFRNPILRPFLRGAHQIPVDRGSGSSAPLESALTALARGEVVVVYPEGTTTRNPDFSPMQGKTGIARLTLTSKVPVKPLAVWGTHRVWRRDSPRRLNVGRPLWAKAGPAMDFSEFADRREDPAVLRSVTDAVMAEITRMVGDLRSRYPKKWE